MKAFRPTKGFSLVETVVALGIFAFCISVLLGVFPVGMRATRSVANEANAIHLSSSIFAMWQAAPTGTQAAPTGTRVFNTNIFGPNSLTVTVGNAAADDCDFDDEGKITTAPSSMQMFYSASAVPGFPGTFRVDLNFVWPPNASPNIQQSRSFSQVFYK